MCKCTEKIVRIKWIKFTAPVCPSTYYAEVAKVVIVDLEILINSTRYVHFKILDPWMATCNPVPSKRVISLPAGCVYSGGEIYYVVRDTYWNDW